MDQRVQCPVCTLYLHSGMSLESHLDTHPKDQVIKALCTLSAKNISFGSRTPTPHSERSYRSRSRTPATEDGRWCNSHRSTDNDRYWRRTPSRTKSTPLSNVSRNGTPDIRIGNLTFENNLNNSTQCSDTYTVKSDKTQQTYGSNGQSSGSDFDPRYPYYGEQPDDSEIKFSRSSEYNAQIENSNNVFPYNMTGIGPIGKQPPNMMPMTRRGNDFVKNAPKQANILLKSNMTSGMQYIAQGVKPLHMMMPTTSPFVQKNLQNNVLLSGNLPNSQIIDPKSMGPTLTNQFSQITSGTFTPGTTVVTQNSQIIYREMVHNLDGKPFLSSMPAVLSGAENITNVAQSSAMYQNVMVVDQFGNTSCMYTTPQHLIPKSSNLLGFTENLPYIQNMTEKSAPNLINDVNKTLVIEVSPIVQKPGSNNTGSTSHLPQPDANHSYRNKKNEKQKSESKIETPGPSKGLKILSNIKVEVPVQHNKNMLNTVMDLTGSDYSERPVSPDKILPDMSDDCTQPSTASGDSLVSNTFSVIKNVGSCKDSSKSSVVDSKIETEFSDSCPVPDLICNEKPSISPCSELSEHGDNSTDCISISPKPGCAIPYQSSVKDINHIDKIPPHKSFRSNPLRLNNIFVKKHKKVLQIKNAKTFPPANINQSEQEPRASSSRSRSPENFVMNKIHRNENIELKPGTLETISIEKIKDNDENNEFDANTEEQSMDIEPVTPSNVNHTSQFNTTVDMVQVKEEINSSNDFSNEADIDAIDLAPMETLRPINVINYGNMAGDFDDDSNHRELLELEAASKNKQFVSMMNENYFGDNIYADYFTPDRVEAFEAAKESNFVKDSNKDGMYIWGEPSQKEGEFVLPTFIHESYKIAESNGIDYSDMGGHDEHIDAEGDRCESDSKADILNESRSDGEPPLNICADERMPPRGELSGQESNGDMESPGSGMYLGVPPTEPYDLIARESWVSDSSDVDANEKTDTLEEELHFPKTRMYSCAQCGNKFPSFKELRAHKALAHALPTCSNTKTTYSRLVSTRAIKKEEKPDEHILAGNLLSLDSKETILTKMFRAYDVLDETKPQIEGLIKQETKKRRKDFVCSTCKVDQVTDAAFNAHLKIHPLECLTCGKCFFRRANLALHVKTHLGIKNYKCEICEKRFITRQKLMEHHNIHTGRTPVKCTVCDDTFRRYSNMVQHRDRHHLKKKAKVRDFVCHCGTVFHSRAKLLWHKETHDARPKACLYCSDKFVHASSLTRHVRRTHNAYFVSDRLKGKNENVPCPICKQMYLRTNLRAHIQTHSGKRPYNCVICNKSFTTKWNLKLHRWTHLSRSAKPYKCNLCKGAFIRHSEYVSHMNSHKSLRPYTCNYCGCKFIRKYNCQRHVREHEMAKKYVCKVPECGKSFHRSYYLSEHMKVHSGARPFSCNICGKTSSNKSNHNKHVKIHHAREPVATEA